CGGKLDEYALDEKRKEPQENASQALSSESFTKLPPVASIAPANLSGQSSPPVFKSFLNVFSGLFLLILFFGSFNLIGLLAIVPTLGAAISLHLIRRKWPAYLVSVFVFFSLHLICVAANQAHEARSLSKAQFAPPLLP